MRMLGSTVLKAKNKLQALLWFFVVITTVTGEECRYDIVTSTPEMLELTELNFKTIPTHEYHIDVINNAKRDLKIASFYILLSAGSEHDRHPSTEPGRRVLEAIKTAAARGVKIQVLLDDSTGTQKSSLDDVATLRKIGEVKFLNMLKTNGKGVMHSKFLIADGESFYVGSANFDWKSFTQVKEIGFGFKNCGTLARDLEKVFRLHWHVASIDELPAGSPAELTTEINMSSPTSLKIDNDEVAAFIAASPVDFNGKLRDAGRTEDLEALLHVIDTAHRRLDISVMKYTPRFRYTWPKKFWPVIDNAIRRAAVERRVQVRMLLSNWTITNKEEIMWYKSLDAIQSDSLKGGGIKVKLFEVPMFNDFHKEVPYTRVKHEKYMVSNQKIWLGTSNWTPGELTESCGLSIVVESLNRDKTPVIVKKIQDIFERDFNSVYAHDLTA